MTISINYIPNKQTVLVHKVFAGWGLELEADDFRPEIYDGDDELILEGEEF